MDAERFERLRSLFHEAAALPAGGRDEYLSAACGGDTALRSEVLGMLEADSAADTLLEGGVPGIARDLFQGGAAFGDLRFGPYRLIRRLGEGGMGVVYLAEREDLGSRVAIKFLRDAWLSPARRERFTEEQRTLAQLIHPSIARLYDADTISDGTPWFAMEYVEGVTITEYLAQHGSSVEERLRLFREVCEAVKYAHERAVIHRDLKPSNILVRSDGAVRLVDFGIAKHLDSADQPVDQTRTALRLMTPAYASPEQIRGEPVGIFTDVYALGVILYEILTGRLPLDVGGRTATEAERIIVSQEPLPPSAVAGGPGLTRASWADLDVLCLTAIHKDLARRYRSVEMLIRDIDHYLNGEPLEARPDTWRYRVRKFVKRNRRAVAASTAAVVVIVAMAVFFTVRLAAARNAAVAASARSQRVQQFMLKLFAGGDKLAAPAEGLRVSTLVDRGVQEVETLQRDPELQADLFATLGRISQELGNLERADRLLQSALDRRRALRGPENPDVAESLVALGLLRVDQARHDDAERLVRQGLDQAKRARPREDAAVARATYALGKVLEARGTYDKAIPLLEDAARMQTTAGSPPVDMAETWKELADAQFYAGHYDICDQMTRRALALHREVYGERHPLVADDLINLGAVESERGNYTSAESYYRRALGIDEAWYGG
ncbi:MAG TPA: protein kinase, partial [Bryobacteraceae bacterium]